MATQWLTLEVGEVRLPHLVNSGGFMFELFCGFDHDIVGGCDEIGASENTIR